MYAFGAINRLNKINHINHNSILRLRLQPYLCEKKMFEYVVNVNNELSNTFFKSEDMEKLGEFSATKYVVDSLSAQSCK